MIGHLCTDYELCATCLQCDGCCTCWGTAFNTEARALILGRDRPPGVGAPWCVVCGEPIRGTPDVHHRQRRQRGNGRPSNGLTVHNRLDGKQCHHTAVHGDVAAARDNGWILSMHLPARNLPAQPLLCAWRGWIVLDNAGGWRPATPDELGQR